MSENTNIDLYNVLVMPSDAEIEAERKREEHDKRVRFCISLFLVSFMGSIICFAIYIDYEMRKEMMHNRTTSNTTY